MTATKVMGVVAAVLAALLLVPTGSASAHGYTDDPASRGRWCQIGAVKDCGPIQYEPQSTEGKKGFPQRGPADGKLCSAGLAQFTQVDQPRTPAGELWPTTTVHADSDYTIEWTLTAAHRTTKWHYYATKPGWNQDRPLTRADLNLVPFHTETYGGRVPPKSYSHRVHLPDLSGRHVILAVWDVDDTSNAFYSCADVYFR